MFRPAEEKDIPAVAGIYEKIHAQESKGQTHTGWIHGVYPAEATAREALHRGDLFVYEEDGCILASAIINQAQGEMYSGGAWQYEVNSSLVMVLHTLTVDPDQGKRGIGRRFVEFYEQYAAQKGCTALRMDTNEKNTVARAFYKKLGYSEIGIVPCVFNGIPDVQLVLLEKPVK